MKNFLLTILMIVISVPAMLAQPHGAMKFVGPSTFGVAAMDAWQDNEKDTILFLMNSGSDADITIYKAMNLTIPSFTIHGAAFSMDFTTRNAIFAEQTIEETLVVEGEEKQIKGSFSAIYNHSAKLFELQLIISYGRMPFPVTYSIKAEYVSPETGIAEIVSPYPSRKNSENRYELSGLRTNSVPSGRIVIQGGKKLLMR